MGTKNNQGFKLLNLCLILLTILTLIFISQINPEALWANNCETVCEKYTDCVVKLHGGKANPRQLRKLKGGCMKSCKKNKAKMIQCYNQSNNNCANLMNCIKKLYIR